MGLGLAVAIVMVILAGSWVQQTTSQNRKMEVLQVQQAADRAAAVKARAAAAASAAARAKAATDAAAAAEKARVDAAITQAQTDAAEAKAQVKANQESTVVVRQPNYGGYYDEYGYYHYY